LKLPFAICIVAVILTREGDRKKEMKRWFAVLLTSVIALGSGNQTLAWGGNGHQTVGKIASLHVRPHTARMIDQILMPGETLASISTWADSVKERMGESDPDADTHRFLQDLVHNEKNREWHYDNLPLNCASYEACGRFTREDDIVHMINAAVRALQGNPHPNHPLSKRNALRLLVHLVGDIHQPLHMGCAFVDERGTRGRILIVKDPNIIRRKNLKHDRGGNQLIIDNDRKKLHSFWDFDLVKSLMTVTNKPTSEELGTFLKQTVAPRNDWNSRSRLTTWAAQWALDSLRQSRVHAYRSVNIIRKRTIAVTDDGQPVMRDGRPVTEVVYDITRAPNYETANRELVRSQLAKAGYRLAKMLDAIYANQR
jgi:hypothetical protein